MMGGVLLALLLTGIMPLVLVGPPSASAWPVAIVPDAPRHVAPPAPRDTLRRQVAAGEPLILTLPGTLDDRSVTAYRPIRVPALSWLVGRSLLWRPRAPDAGPHALHLRATFDTAPADTLTLLISVTE